VYSRTKIWLKSCVLGVLACLAAAPLQAAAAAGSSRVAVPLGLVAGMTAAGPADSRTLLRIAIEYEPQPGLENLAAAMTDPAAAAHRRPLSAEAFAARFGRDGRDGDALAAFLRAIGTTDIFVSRNRLVGGGIIDVGHARHAFSVRFLRYTAGERTAIAPSGPLTVPLPNIRAVHGVVAATTPRLADVPSFTLFRGDWYTPVKLREAYQAVPNGGGNERISIVEDASDRFDLHDIAPFLSNEGAPPGATAERVIERSFAFKAAASQCGRDDRGQEPALDADAALAMAPLATVVLDYEDVCSEGNDGTLALERALDDREPPTVVVFPFTIGPAPAPVADLYGKPSIPMLEAIVRGIPLIVPAGNDGAYGYRIPGIDTPAVAYPCVSTYVICAGGTQVGDRDGAWDDAPWNDGVHATGGGISLEPRPPWQDPTGAYEFSAQFVKTRMVPDVAADAAGHLRIYWHGYGLGGVGGTSESASIVGGQLAAVNSFVAATRRLTIAGDLYALAKAAPAAFRDVQRENDRGYTDNTLRPAHVPLPPDFRGQVPPPPKPVYGCAAIEPHGCSARKGYDAVSGIGVLMEKAAVDALR
jgi:subtilase family serine protease